MPMTRERHEEIINALNNPELEHSERTDLLTELREDYGGVLTDFDDLNKKADKLTRDNQDLVISNSKLFRERGIEQNPDMQKKEDEKNFSETVTIEQLEKNAQAEQ